MIIVRAPLRITFGGGGTDVRSYSRRHGGYCVSAAINKYCYVIANHSFHSGIKLKYSEYESVDNQDSIKHPIFREALGDINLKTPQIEVASIADVPSNGSGLGNSGAFTVALVRSLYGYKNIPVSQEFVAKKACDININRLGKIQGKQDEYISSFGGISSLEFEKDGNVVVTPLKITHDTLVDLEENLLLFYTGISHNTEEILSYQNEKTKDDDEDIVRSLHEVKALGYLSVKLLETGQTKGFGELLNEQHLLKEKRMPEANLLIKHVHERLPYNGAIGSKIVGSGLGGFFMVYAEDKKMVRHFMKNINMEEMRFAFDFEGCRRIV